MLEIGRSGSAGTEKGVVPVLRDGAVVATLRAAKWKAAATAVATAVVDGRTWTYGRRGKELTGRWAEEPEDTARLRAWQTSYWKGTWSLDLEGALVEVRTASAWRGTRQYLAAGKQVAESGTTGRRAWRPTLTADDGLPLAHQVFLLWLEMVLRQRAATAAGAATAGGAAAAGAAG